MRSIVGGVTRAAPPQMQPRLDLQAAAGCFSVLQQTHSRTPTFDATHTRVTPPSSSSLWPESAVHASVGSSWKQALCFLSSSAQFSSPAQPPAHQPKFTHRDAGAWSRLKMALFRIYSFLAPFHLLVLCQALRNYPDNEGKSYNRCHVCALWMFLDFVGLWQWIINESRRIHVHSFLSRGNRIKIGCLKDRICLGVRKH